MVYLLVINILLVYLFLFSILSPVEAFVELLVCADSFKE
jgi:hypothetical protein